MSEVQTRYLPEGDSRLDYRKIEGTEKEDEFITIVASGVSDPKEIAKRLKMNVTQIERSLRDNALIGKIKQAIQAKAVMMMPKMLDQAYGDSEAKRASVRSQAREYIRKVAEGEPAIVQQNNQIQAWDPSIDERLFEKGRAMFQSLAEVAAETTVHRMMEDED